MNSQGSAPRKKKVVPVSQMKSTTLYVCLSDKKTYRKLNGKLEVMDGPGNWLEVKVTMGFLEHEKFREY